MPTMLLSVVDTLHTTRAPTAQPLEQNHIMMLATIALTIMANNSWIVWILATANGIRRTTEPADITTGPFHSPSTTIRQAAQSTKA